MPFASTRVLCFAGTGTAPAPASRSRFQIAIARQVTLYVAALKNHGTVDLTALGAPFVLFYSADFRGLGARRFTTRGSFVGMAVTKEVNAARQASPALVHQQLCSLID
jgi:hypothetical protein